MSSRRPTSPFAGRQIPDRADGALACARARGAAIWAVIGALQSPLAAFAAEAPVTSDESFAVHGQFTYVEQETGSFNAPYRGANSLSPDSGRETIDATLYVGRKLWQDAEAWVNIEVDQGFGLDNTLGAAGFPSGEAYKVGKTEPYLRLSRTFVRQTFNIGGTRETAEPAQNQLASSYSADRVVLTAGKFGVGDVFDTNQFAHDPRGDFLNWSALDASTFDYAADAWGYTVGVAAEWYTGPWTFRAGAFDLSDVPNSPRLEPGADEFQLVVEVERRFELAGHPSRVLATAYDSRGRMGLLTDAVNLSEATGNPVDVAAVRHTRNRTGVHVSLEEQLSEDLGAFARAGGASGNVEVYEFTDADRTLELGLSLKGARWGRADDRVAIAGVVNEVSAARQQYLDAGGLGLLIGDGRLPHPGPERILETYYDFNVYSSVHVTLDYQRIVNPAYNRDRGPASVFAIRLHAQF